VGNRLPQCSGKPTSDAVMSVRTASRLAASGPFSLRKRNCKPIMSKARCAARCGRNRPPDPASPSCNGHSAAMLSASIPTGRPDR